MLKEDDPWELGVLWFEHLLIR